MISAWKYGPEAPCQVIYVSNYSVEEIKINKQIGLPIFAVPVEKAEGENKREKFMCFNPFLSKMLIHAADWKPPCSITHMRLIVP